jgi:large subunit ribosomal protein L9
MKLILRKPVEKLGESGDVVDVKPGYARNYLIPHGLAYVASDANLQRLEQEQKDVEEHAKRHYLEARRRASQIEGASVTFGVRAGEDGKLFGSITNADIADRLGELDLDFEIDRRNIELEEPLRQLGVFNVVLKLYAQVEVPIEVRIERGEE